MPNTTAVGSVISGRSTAGQASYGSHSTRNDGGHRGVDGVHKPEPAADEIAGQDEAKDAGGQSDNDLQHIEFRI